MDASVMDTPKKIYNMPELIEHGSLVEITQYNCLDTAYDGIEGEGFGSWDQCE